VLAVELHAHSALSHDGRDPVEALLERAREVGLDALAVTDHDAISASLDAAEKAPDYGLVGIPGLEVSTADGHLLALGVREVVPAGHPFEATVDRIHDRGGLAVVPHPFHATRHGVGKNVDGDALAEADAIEVFNSRLLTGIANYRAERFARRRGLPTTAGSDAHVAEMVGRATTFVDAVPDAEAIVEAIADGRTELERRRTPLGAWVRQFARSGYQRTQQRLGR